ncbi:MAG: hypothetical protein M1827_003932 [Pycnora praestabilis]|nr:MAG: hypothetical protein M1827_003932 [Pycnora praestabilis]
MASYRSIRPSNQSSQSRSGSASLSTASDPTLGGVNESSGSQGAPKKRRPPKFVTPNACTNCKKARAKCDGNKPACSRCVSREQESACHYEVHVKTAKEEMVREIKDLQEKNDRVERILSALVRDTQGPEIITRLRNNESYQSIAEALGRPPVLGIRSLSPTAQRHLSDALMDYELDWGSSRDPESGLIQGNGWTNVTSDDDLINHLLSLYFTWVHPSSMVFSEAHFRASFRNHSNLYCSSALVNAICAMGCHLYDDHDEKFEKEELSNPAFLREAFMQEARSLIKPHTQQKMATIQTFSIMFMVDLASGKGLRASSYIRLAAEKMTIRQGSHYSTEAAQIAAWGIYSLNIAWAEFTHQIPSNARVPAEDVFPDVDLASDAAWRFYRHSGNADVPEQPSSATLTALENAKLFRIIHHTINMFYDGHSNDISAKDIMQQFKRLLAWKDELSENVALLEKDAAALPHTLTLHIQYFTALVNLFRPLLALESFSAPAHEHLRAIAVKYAKRGLDMVETYRGLYTCRYQPSLQTFCVLHMCDLLIKYNSVDPTATEVVRFCLTVLKESADGQGGFSVCGPLQETFRQAAVEYGVALPDDLDELMVCPPSQYSPDDVLDACTRLSYAQPVNQVNMNFESTMADDFAEEWREFIEGYGSVADVPNSSAGRSMHIGSLLNE